MTMRALLLGTLWVTVCLILFGNPVGVWPFILYLCAARWLVFIDEGHEASLMRAELRQVLNGQRSEA